MNKYFRALLATLVSGLCAVGADAAMNADYAALGIILMIWAVASTVVGVVLPVVAAATKEIQ